MWFRVITSDQHSFCEKKIYVIFRNQTHEYWKKKCLKRPISGARNNCTLLRYPENTITESILLVPLINRTLQPTVPSIKAIASINMLNKYQID